MFDNRLVEFRDVNYETDLRRAPQIRRAQGANRLQPNRLCRLKFRIARQFQTLLDRKVSALSKIFREEEQAVEWLIKQRRDKTARLSFFIPSDYLKLRC